MSSASTWLLTNSSQIRLSSAQLSESVEVAINHAKLKLIRVLNLLLLPQRKLQLKWGKTASWPGLYGLRREKISHWMKLIGNNILSCYKKFSHTYILSRGAFFKHFLCCKRLSSDLQMALEPYNWAPNESKLVQPQPRSDLKQVKTRIESIPRSSVGQVRSF